MPASLFAKLLYGNKKLKKSKKLFDLNALIASVGLIGLLLFPLYWIAKIGMVYLIAYIAIYRKQVNPLVYPVLGVLAVFTLGYHGMYLMLASHK